MWFTEDPWPPVLILAVFAVVFGLAWNATRRKVFLLLAAGMLFLGFAVFVGEEMIETESEKVQSRVLALADAVRHGEKEQVQGYFAADAQSLRQQVAAHVDDIQFEELRITGLKVEVNPEGTQAQSDFHANGSGTFRKTLSSNFATRWNLTWQKEAGVWKVVQIERLDPIQGNVIGTWSGM